MNHAERSSLINDFMETHCFPVMSSKGQEYSKGSGSVEANANFYLIAQLLDGAPMDAHTAMMIYFMKHFAWLCEYTKNREEGTEGFESRVGDMVNYLLIMAAEYKKHQPHNRIQEAAQIIKQQLSAPILSWYPSTCGTHASCAKHFGKATCCGGAWEEEANALEKAGRCGKCQMPACTNCFPVPYGEGGPS